VDAPTDMTSGSEAGEPIALYFPASPAATTTVTPAATALSLNSLTASSDVTSGNGSEPNDSSSTLTC
jgi:hypothetical protein